MMLSKPHHAAKIEASFGWLVIELFLCKWVIHRAEKGRTNCDFHL